MIIIFYYNNYYNNIKILKIKHNNNKKIKLINGFS